MRREREEERSRLPSLMCWASRPGVPTMMSGRSLGGREFAE